MRILNDLEQEIMTELRKDPNVQNGENKYIVYGALTSIKRAFNIIRNKYPDLTPLQIDKLLTCVDFARNSLETERIKLERDYNIRPGYNKELDEKINSLKEAETFYSDLQTALKSIF